MPTVSQAIEGEIFGAEFGKSILADVMASAGGGRSGEHAEKVDFPEPELPSRARSPCGDGESDSRYGADGGFRLGGSRE